MASKPSPLAGIRVVDFGQHLAGPLAGRLLAEHGAEVTRIIRPKVSHPETPLDALLSRGKHCSVLDLKTDAGRASAADLVASADVIIENFRPGVMRRLGLGADTMTQQNPRLIYLSLPGFASDDASVRDLPAWEGVIGAACGLYTDVNLLGAWLDLPPVYSALPYGSVYGAVHGVVAILMALVARGRTGVGEIIEVPLASAAMSAMGSSIMRVPRQPRRYDLPLVGPIVQHVVVPLVRWLLTNAGPRWQARAYQAASGMIPALMTSYPCADDRLLYIYATDHLRHARDLLGRLGLMDALEREALKVRDAYAAGGGRNNLAEASLLSRRWQRRLHTRIAERLRRRPAAVWEAELGAAGVPCAMQRSIGEWLSLAPVRQAGIVTEDDEPGFGRIRAPGPACWLREVTGAASGKEASRKVDGVSALSGIRVLDLSTMVAGPVCARTLAEYGADVIKIESPHPLHGPRMTCWFGIEVDQGKRSLLLDLTTGDGHDILSRLIERADVVVHNFSRKASDRLGLSVEALARLNPGLVLCRLGAIEGPQDGPWTARKGYDPVLQAASGIMVRYGNSERPEYHGLASCIDYLTGYCAAMGAALALYRRARDPDAKGAEAVTSLAQGAQLIQLPFAFDFAGHAWDEPSGQQCRGSHPLHRLYRASDGWLFLDARSDKREVVLGASELACPLGLEGPADKGLERFLERRLRKETIAHWKSVFRPLDVTILPVRSLSDIRRTTVEPRPEARYLMGGPTVQVVRQSHPAGGHVDTLAPAYARLRSHPLRYLDPAPKPGSQSFEILAELGYSREDCRRLVTQGVVATELCKEYLPP